MATYAYVGKTRQGATKKGEVSAKNREEAVQRLRKQSVLVTSIEEKGGKGGESIWNMEIGGGGVSDKDIVIFTRQFGTMINAGLPLIQCLDILGSQSENKTLRKALMDVKLHVESGGTFADSLRRHPKVFDELFTNMIHAGEVGGLLDTILARLSKHIEKAMKLKSAVKSAMVYPAVILGVSLVVITVLLIWVIPTFAQMFHEMSGGKQGLPGPTQLVIDVSNFAQEYILFIVGGATGLFFAVKGYYGTAKGRLNMDRLFLKIPVVGELIRKTAVAKFTRTLGTLITSGVPLLEGLAITAKTAGNKVIEVAVQDARISISGGKTIAEPLSKGNIFPRMVTHMIAVGETTGALDTMLGKIADFYEDEVDSAVATLTSLLEPAMMVFLGVLIGFIVIAMYLPIFKMAQTMG